MDKIKDFEINSPRWLSLEDFDGEEWKTIAGYETLYEISNYGRIKCFRKNGRIVYIKKPFMAKHRCNYWMAELYKDHKKKRFFLHRLVAIAFIPNPNNLPQVNHKDEDKTNPIASNLEWCDQKYNSNYGTMPYRMRKLIRRRREEDDNHEFRRGFVEVHQYSIKGEYLATYHSIKEAGEKLGINPSGINDVLFERGKITAGGYLWTRTKDEAEVERKKNKLSYFPMLPKIGFFRRNNSFPIEQYTLNDEYIATYRSALAAAKENGLFYGSILKCAKGKWNQYKGYKWKFAKQYERSL